MFCELLIDNAKCVLRRAITFPVFLLLINFPAFAQADGVLILNQPVERELKGGQSHSYRISLSSAQYLNVSVNQKGIDVVVILLGPNGQKMLEVDSPTGDKGQEKVLFVSEAAGEYILEIRSLEQNAPSGRYEANVVELRAATEKDKHRIIAEKTFSEGESLVSQGTATSIQKAIEKYSESLSHWKLVEDKKEEAATLNALGLALGFFDGAKALEAYTQAVRLYEELGEKRRLSRVQHNIGLLYKLSDPRKALEYFKPALETFRSSGDRFAEPVALNNIGECHYYLSEHQAALNAFEPALALFREQNNSRDVALVLSNMGLIYGLLDDIERERENYEQSLALRRTVGDKRGQGNALNNLAFVYYKQGDMNKALELYEQALTIRQAIGAQREAAVTLRNMGTVYRSLGQLQRALETYQTALATLQTANDLFWSARTLGSIGIAYFELGNNQRARESFLQALAMSQQTGNKGDEAQMRYWLALLDQREGNLAEAENNIKEALVYVESLRSTLFNAEQRSGYFASVQSFFELYTDLLMQKRKQQPDAKFDALAFQVSERSRARSLLELLNESQANIRQGAEPKLLDEERRLQQQFNLKTTALTRLTAGKPTEAQVTALRNEIDSLKKDYEQVQTQIRISSPRYAALTQPQPLNLTEVQQQVLDNDTLLLQYSLGKQRSYLWLVGKDSFQSFELPERAKIETAARRVYELLTARNKRVKFETVDEKRLRVSQADVEITKATTELSEMILAPAAKALTKKKLLIVADGALQFIPFATLPIPSSNLETNSNGQRTKTKSEIGNRKSDESTLLLIASYEIINLPSVSTLGILRRDLQNRKPASKAVTIIADPVFAIDDERFKLAKKTTTSQELIASRGIESIRELTRSAFDVEGSDERVMLSRLPFTRKEADAIVRLVPVSQQKKVIDFAANRAAATSEELGQYRIVHFATHGLLNTVHPELSGLVFSLIDEQGKPQSGFLRSHEIFNLRLPADLIVLSACRTGLGKEIRGEGIVGLTRGFMYAGAARVAVSLWDVHDEATAELMTRFYRGMLKEKLSPSAALRQAQVSMMKDSRWSSPYYWASFVLQGEPN